MLVNEVPRRSLPGKNGQVTVESVVKYLWNGWSNQRAISGQMGVEYPTAAAEDEGVVLSVVLNTGKGNSFLLVLDAASFTERARAEVPHPIPFGFHGQLFRT